MKHPVSCHLILGMKGAARGATQNNRPPHNGDLQAPPWLPPHRKESNPTMGSRARAQLMALPRRHQPSVKEHQKQRDSHTAINLAVKDIKNYLNLASPNFSLRRMSVFGCGAS